MNICLFILASRLSSLAYCVCTAGFIVATSDLYRHLTAVMALFCPVATLPALALVNRQVNFCGVKSAVWTPTHAPSAKFLPI